MKERIYIYHSHHGTSVIVCILFSKKRNTFFSFIFCSFVRLFFISCLFFQRTSYVWTSEIFQHCPFFHYTHTYHSNFGEFIFFPVLFFLASCCYSQRKAYIYIYRYLCVCVCVYFFYCSIFFPIIESKQTNKDCNCFMSFFLLLLLFSFICHKQEKKQNNKMFWEKKTKQISSDSNETLGNRY